MLTRPSWKMYCFAVWLVFFVLTPRLDAATVYVATNGVGDGAGGWANATNSIQGAIDAAGAGDTVMISNGMYVLTNQITVSSSITISGIAVGDKPVVDGNNAGRCFEFTAAATGVLANLFVTGGYTNSGGGLYMRSGTVRDCVFSNNFAFSSASYSGGGGAYFIGGTNLIQDCMFVNNTASNSAGGGGLYLYGVVKSIIAGCTFRTNITYSHGGGINAYYNFNNNTLITGCYFICNVATNNGGGGYFNDGTNNIITHCAFDGNVSHSNDGGGMYMSGSGWICSNSFFSNNIAAVGGGGMVLKYGATVADCVIARNTSQVQSGANTGGGGIQMVAAATLAQNCTVEENRAGYFGGGIYLSGGTLRNCLIRNNVALVGGGFRVFAVDATISSCTIVSNYASSAGGGLHFNTWNGTYLVKVENSIIYFNNSVTAASSNLYDNTAFSYLTTFSNCLVAGFNAAPAVTLVNCITNQDPQVVQWTSGNYRLSKGSPCVNTGVNRDWMTGAVDLDGRRRLDRFSGLVDAGCYEYLPKGSMFIVR